MKFSTFASTVFGAALLLASKVVADVDYFDFPSPNAVFHAGSTIQFVVDDMPDGDDDERVYANLYRENGSFVKTIRSWDNDYVDDDEFAFTWCIDRNLRSGRYFVEVFSDDDDDDVSRSFIFDIVSPSSSSYGNKENVHYNRKPMVGGGRKNYRPARGGYRKWRHTKRTAAIEEAN